MQYLGLVLAEVKLEVQIGVGGMSSEMDNDVLDKCLGLVSGRLASWLNAPLAGLLAGLLIRRSPRVSTETLH